MPESMSLERRKLLRAFGAEIVLTPASDGMQGAVREAERLAAEMGAFLPSQFENPDNPTAHYQTTGPEIYRDTKGRLAAFVATVGTGGTLSGTGRYLKEQDAAIRIVAVEPADSPLLSKGYAAPHAIQGIGANFVPEVLDTNIYDEVIPVTEEEAYTAGRLLARREGILAGISSGAALHAAIGVASRPENAGKTVVVLLPDTGDRYLSTPLFQE
jgi:cysteine synthase A